MGYMRHHAIVVTGWDPEVVRCARELATTIFNGHGITEVVGSLVNGYYTFLVPPDGSKEGWDDSVEGDARRAKFIEGVEQQFAYLDWAEVQYGDDNLETKIVNDSDSKQRAAYEKEQAECQTPKTQ